MRLRKGHLPLVLLAALPSCGGVSDPGPPPSTTTTTTSTTTTTTTMTTTTTTTLPRPTTTPTTTTMPAATYAVVHPIWTSRGCVGCHTGNTGLVLSGTAAAVCPLVRNGTDRQMGQYLDNPACTASGSSIIRVPASGLLPGGSAHPIGVDACFASGGACQRDILAWCRAGAGC